MSWFTKLSWDQKQLPDMVVKAFDLEPIAENHRAGKLTTSEFNDPRHRFYTDIQGLLSSQIRLSSETYPIEVMITLTYKTWPEKTYNASIGLLAARDPESSAFNDVVYHDLERAKLFTQVANDYLKWGQDDLLRIPRDIVTSSYVLIDKYLGFGGDEDDESPTSPSPQPEFTPEPVMV